MKARIELAIDELWVLWHKTDDVRVMDNLISAICALEDALSNLENDEQDLHAVRLGER